MNLDMVGRGRFRHSTPEAVINDEKQAANFEKRPRRKTAKALSTGAGAPVRVCSKVKNLHQKEKQKASKPEPSAESARPKVLKTSLYMDGRTV